MALKTMYAPQVNSPATTTTGAITATSTTVTVLSGSVLPSAPMLLVLGDSEIAETVLMTGKSGNTLTIQRAVEGKARYWQAGTPVARLFTAKDLKDVQDNIRSLSADLTPISTADIDAIIGSLS